MNVIKTATFSEGKHQRNDDFVLVRPVFNNSAVGVVGDFTSDSPEGINQRLVGALARYLDECIPTWQEHLTPARNMVSLVTRFINNWLGERKTRARTTLVAIAWDAWDRHFYYTSIGDSGLAVAGPRGVRFLRKGDTTGLRDASGFLPLTSDNFNLEKAAIAADETLFAFTDGFWESTRHFIDPNQCEPLLQGIFCKHRLIEIDAEVRSRIIAASNHVDDLTLLIFVQQPEGLPSSADLLPFSLHELARIAAAGARRGIEAYKTVADKARNTPPGGTTHG